MENPNDAKTKSDGQATAETITGRIRSGARFIERTLGERDKIACKRFLDGSESGAFLLYDDDGDGILPEAQEVGSVNYLAINILTKTAAVAIGDPDFHVDTGSDDPLLMQQQEGQEAPDLSRQDMAEVVRRFLRTLWEMKGWSRTFRKVLLKRGISGMGILAYLWHDEDGPLFEHVRARDFAVDPCVTDWRNLHWGARRIRMRREDAVARYPKLKDMVDTSPAQSDIVDLDGPSPMSKNVVELWIYWDKQTEATCCGSEVLEQGPNLYGRVPLLILEGDIAPESELSLGDYDTCAQIQEQLARYQSMINEQAENGGAIGWVNLNLLDSDTQKTEFQNGRPNSFIQVNGSGEDAIGYIEGQPSDPMLMNAFADQRRSLDSATGVSQFQRGEAGDVKTATEVAFLANQSGARGGQARIEFEQFVNFAARCLLQMVVAFAPSMMQDGAPEDALLLQSIQAVQDIKVIESSTSYKDPNAEIQTNLQLMQALAPFFGTLIDPRPIIADTLRAFGKRDVQKYFLQPPVPQPGPPGVQPPPQGQPGAPAEQVPASGPPAPSASGEGAGPPQAAPSNTTIHFHGGK
jgi:hypothetical protein